MNVNIGVGDGRVSADPTKVLVTYSLGSCVGVTLYDPVRRLGGLVHCTLPLSRAHPERAGREPFRFADTGVLKLLQAMLDAGARRDRLVARVAGAARMLEGPDPLTIGKRNYTVVRKILWKNGILIAGQDVGGRRPRTMRLYLADGRTTIADTNGEREI